MKNIFTLLAVFMLLASPASAAAYEVDKTASSVTFSASHAGNPFEGKFESWTASIDFDPATPATGKITATFDLASAKTGNSMYDGTLPQADWFDVKNNPQGSFASTAITALGDTKFKVAGDLTLRGFTKPVSFEFTMADTRDAKTIAEATITLDRLLFDIGKKSDAKAEWVSQNIDIKLKIVAQKQG